MSILSRARRHSGYVMLFLTSGLSLLGGFYIDREPMSAVLLNLGSAGMFATVFTQMVGRVEAARNQESYRSDFEPVAQELQLVRAAVTSFDANHLADRVFRARHERDHDAGFNNELNNDIQQSTLFRFRGGTGGYSIARLANIEMSRVELLLPDPRSDQAVRPRAVQRMKADRALKDSPEATRWDIDEYIVQMREDIYMTVCGLAELHGVMVTIGFFAFDASDRRVEITAQACYVGVRDEKTSAAFTPTTFRYPAGRFWYEHYDREFTVDLDHLKGVGRTLTFEQKRYDDYDIVRMLNDLTSEGSATDEHGKTAVPQLVSVHDVKRYRRKAAQRRLEMWEIVDQ